jgi:hypothetical protein
MNAGHSKYYDDHVSQRASDGIKMADPQTNPRSIRFYPSRPEVFTVERHWVQFDDGKNPQIKAVLYAVQLKDKTGPSGESTIMRIGQEITEFPDTATIEANWNLADPKIHPNHLRLHPIHSNANPDDYYWILTETADT